MKKRRTQAFLAAAAIAFLLIIPALASAITLTEPRFGVANQSVFNVTVTTSSAASCKYSSPFEKPFAEMAAFTETGGAVHKLKDFTLPANGLFYKFFAECSNAEKGSFDLAVDSSQPSITRAVAVPGTVIETPFETRLIVETNKNTTCRYDDQFYTYDTMRNFFKAANADQDKANYENYHEAVVSGLADKTSYGFNVSCMDLSQQRSAVSKIAFNVDTSVPPVISQLLPASGFATSSPIVALSVTTSKKSVCSYDNNTEYLHNDGNFSLTTVNHQALLVLPPGGYTYYVKCLFEGPKEVTSVTTFFIDSTPPPAPEVNVSQDLKGVEEGYTYYLDRIKIRFKSEDKESGIYFYNYSIADESGNSVLNWTTTSDASVTATGLKLKDGEKYFVSAFAQNKAGLKSSVSQSSGVLVNVLLNTEYACSDKIKDGQESDVDCGGSCKTKCSNGKSCSFYADCKSNYCVNYVCRAGNCTDNYQNNDETDVDCGGSCSVRCSSGFKCQRNSDCESLICTEGICVPEGPCSNKVLDPGETDIDCGGLCASVKGKKCAVNRNCIANSDCQTGICNPLGKCAAQSDVDGDGVLNSVDNCPNVANKEQKDSDRDKTGDACDPDNDNDGMPDEWEKKYALNSLSQSDAPIDSDQDGLANLEEFKLGTSPRKKDTDGDGADDGKEVKEGTDPADPNSKPGSSFGVKAAIALFFIAVSFVAVLAFIGFRRKREIDEFFRSNSSMPPLRQPGQQQQAREVANMPRHRQPLQQRSGYDAFDELNRTYSRLSGEEIFEELRRKTGRR